MTTDVDIELDEDVFDSLVAIAKTRGKTPQEVLETALEEQMRSIAMDGFKRSLSTHLGIYAELST